MTAQPEWSPVNDETADLLSLVAVGPVSTGAADKEWHDFTVSLALAAGASPDGYTIKPNTLRRLVRGTVAPQRCGAFVNRALARGLIEWRGEWETSDDREGRNAGRPAKVYRWIGDDQ